MYADSLLFWQVVSGAEFCQIVDGGRCVSDGAWDHGVHEYCKVQALRPLAATATEFDTEENYDFLTVAGTQYHGSEGPQGLPLDAGAELVWTTDGTEVRPGFTVCANETSSLFLALGDPCFRFGVRNHHGDAEFVNNPVVHIAWRNAYIWCWHESVQSVYVVLPLYPGRRICLRMLITSTAPIIP